MPRWARALRGRPVNLHVPKAVTNAESDHPVEDVQPERREEERQGHFAQEVGHAAIQSRSTMNLTGENEPCAFTLMISSSISWMRLSQGAPAAIPLRCIETPAPTPTPTTAHPRHHPRTSSPTPKMTTSSHDRQARSVPGWSCAATPQPSRRSQALVERDQRARPPGAGTGDPTTQGVETAPQRQRERRIDVRVHPSGERLTQILPRRGGVPRAAPRVRQDAVEEQARTTGRRRRQSART
jgi:hypothetical protein